MHALTHLWDFGNRRSKSAPHDDLELGLLDPISDAEPQTHRAQLPPEIWVQVFSQVASFRARLDLQEVCQKWRTVCQDAYNHHKLYGDEAMRYVGKTCLQMPTVRPLYEGLPAATRRTSLNNAIRALAVDCQMPIVDLAQQSYAWRQEARRVDLLRQTWQHYQHRYQYKAPHRGDVLQLIFVRGVAWGTIPICIAWAIVEAAVPPVRHAMAHSPLGVSMSVGLLGPVIAVGLAASFAGIIVGVDAAVAEATMLRKRWLCRGYAQASQLPAFVPGLERRLRNMQPTTCA